jgi:2-polyprenyl-3-methyl-5-hydroxy-6-metoxy-1,4-benzoquinol methylase
MAISSNKKSKIRKIYKNTPFNQKHQEKIFWNNYWKEKIKYYQKYGEIFEIRNRWGFFCNQELHHHYKSLVGDFRNLSIIECGAGSGYNSCLMALEGAKTTVIDSSPEAIKYAKIVASRMKVNKKMRFICEDILNFKPTKTFDLAWNCGVIEHYSDRDAILIIEKMVTLVKSGGRIIITIPNLLSPEGIYRMLKKIIKRERISERYITPTHLKKIMELARLTEVKIIPVNYFLPSFLPSQYANFARKFQITKFIKSLSWLFSGIGIVLK